MSIVTKRWIGGSGTMTYTVTPSATFTRPADTTAYASGDLVANSVTAGSVTPLSWSVARTTGGSFSIRRVRIKTSSTSVTNAQFRLHLYTVTPVCANGDNGVFSTDNSSTYLGSMDVIIDRAFSDGACNPGTPVSGAEISGVAVAQTIYGLLEARAAYTPTSAGTFTVALEVFQN